MNTNERLSPQLADALQRITAQGLSTRSRFGHVALLLAALGMGVLSASLLTTEPDLPLRTVLAFAAMLAISLCWIGYALWTLRNRHTLLAQHRIVAARMAVGFTALFTAAALGAGVVGGSAAGFLAAATGAAMLAAAILLLRRAHQAMAHLQQRRRRLEAELGGAGA